MKPKPPADLWAQLDAIVGDSLREDEGFTKAEFETRYNVKKTTAAAKLAQLVKDGKLIQGKRRNPRGGWMKVYRMAD